VKIKKITQIFGLFFLGKKISINFVENVLGYILGVFYKLIWSPCPESMATDVYAVHFEVFSSRAIVCFFVTPIHFFYNPSLDGLAALEDLKVGLGTI
jgi:hypothetical protein